VKRSATRKLGAYAGLSALGLLASLALGLPELAALAVPFAVIAGTGLALAERIQIDASFTLERELMVEGEAFDAELVLRSRTAVERLDVMLELPDGIAAVEGDTPYTIRLDARSPRTLPFRLRGDRWGGYALGDVLLRAHDRLGVVVYEARLDRRQVLKVYPRPEPLQALLRPVETQVFSGNRVAREKGEGIEFADLRQFLPGDRIRRVNWRASARRGELWVNEFHAERNTDVILFLDTFAEARREGESTLDRAVRATAALANHYLRHKDRVGLVSFGGILNWLLPATGLTQIYRIVDSLIDTEVILNYAWKELGIIPRRTLPPKALVIALTPLLDDRALGALVDLRARGFDLTIVDVSPVPFVQPGTDEHEQLAYRLWLLRRRALRSRYERLGVPVAVWDDDTSFAAALEGVREFRRRAPRLRAS
jgi:uncharacterized protein (DUF58 family)